MPPATKRNTAAAEKPAASAPDALREVVKWVLAGQSEADILEAIAIKWPTAAAKPLIIDAIQQLTNAGMPNPQMIRGFAIEATREIYRAAREIGDHQVALRALKQLAELAG